MWSRRTLPTDGALQSNLRCDYPGEPPLTLDDSDERLALGGQQRCLLIALVGDQWQYFEEFLRRWKLLGKRDIAATRRGLECRLHAGWVDTRVHRGEVGC